MSRVALVTGAGGFVGRLLCEYLADRGWEVRGCDVEPAADSFVEFTCDVGDGAQVDAMVKRAAPVTHVFHLAAITPVRRLVTCPSLK